MSRTFKIVLGILLPILVGAAIWLKFGKVVFSPNVRDDLAPFIHRFGPPDEETTNADEKPRPLIFIRRIIYRAEKVRVNYVPADNSSPVENWRFLGMQDAETHESLGVLAAIERLAKRDRSANGAHAQ
jgi:hypothetical protein